MEGVRCGDQLTRLLQQQQVPGAGGPTLRLVVVHAVLAGQGLDERRQRRVPPHVVAVPDAALHLWDGTAQGENPEIRCLWWLPGMLAPSCALYVLAHA